MPFARIICVLLLLTCATVQAQTDPGTAEQLLKQSGMWNQLGSLATDTPKSIASQLGQLPKIISPTEKARIEQLVTRAFSADRLRSTALDIVAKEISPVHLTPLQRWFNSPDGVKVRHAEEAATKEQLAMPPDTLMREGQELLGTLAPTRLTLIRSLVTASRSAEANVQIATNMMVAMFRGLAMAVPSERAIPVEQLRAGMDAQRSAMLEAFTDQSMVSFALTYRSLPDQTLRKYTAFIKTKHGQHFNDLSIQALDKAMIDAALSIGQELPTSRDNNNI